MTLRSAILALLLCAAHAQARTLYVSLTGSHDTNAPAFSTWATAATNIQAAINAAEAGDTVRVGPGTYTGSTPSDSETAVAFVTNEVHLVAGNGTLFDAERTIIDAQFASGRACVAFGKATNASIRGFTLTRGNKYGGAIRAAVLGAFGVSPNVIIDSCIVRNNLGDTGPIVNLPGIGSRIRNSIIVGNEPSYNDAAIYGNYAPSYVENCIVEANRFCQINIANVRNTIYGNTKGTITSLGGNITNNTTNSVMRLLDIAPASEGVGTNLVWRGVSAYIPRLGSLARKNGQPYAGIETDSDGAGGPALVQAGAEFLGRDYSTNRNHGGAVGGVTASTNSPFDGGGSAAFDGASGHITLGGYPIGALINGASGVTVEAWAKPSTLSGNKFFFGSRIYSTYAGVDFYLNGTNLTVGGRSQPADGYKSATYGIATSNEWMHVAGIYDYPNDYVLIYLNGALVKSNAATFGAATYTLGTPTQNDSIGDSPAGGYLMSGNLSDLRIWNVARTPEQIAANYTNRLTGTEEGLVGYWPLTETVNPIDTGPFNLDNPTIHPTYLEAF